MKTNSLKKAFTALAVSAVAVSSVSLSAFATANNGFTDEEIANSPLKPVVTIDRVELTWDEAQEHINNHTPVMVEFNLSGGMDGKYCATGMHVFFDNRLTHVLNKKGTPDVKRGDATELFDMARFDAYGDDCIFVATGSAENCGYDGLMYTFQFYIPDDAQPDDLYPIDVQYASTADAEDKFTDVADSDSAKLAQGYFFTKGIEEGGWIHIEDKEEETTTTTTPAPETTTTTTPAPATTTTTTPAPATTTTTTTPAPATTTTTTTPAPATTTTTTGSIDNGEDDKTKTTTTGEARPDDQDNSRTTTTAKPDDDKKSSSTSTTKTTAAKSNTSSSSSSSPKTGVAGVGVAAAGLAVAIGTAFVLRKKND